jgi:signal peptidase I
VSEGVTSLFDPPPPRPWRPRPWLSALLSAVVPGTGQLYASRPLRAVIVSSVAMAWPAVVLVAVTPLGSAAARLAGLTMGILLFAIVPAIDAWHLADADTRAGVASAPHSAKWYTLGAYAAFVLLALRPLVVGPLLTRVVQIYRVDGVSMSLTLQNDDRVIATPFSGPVRRRMVVVWRADGGAIVTHRVVGMPGDRLEMRNFMLLVNGLDVEGAALRPANDVHVADDEFAWQREFLTGDVPPQRYRPSYGDWGPIRVPRDRYFVLGDNRYGSRDSRQRGFVRRDQILSRVRWVVAAFDHTTHGPRFDRMGHDVP